MKPKIQSESMATESQLARDERLHDTLIEFLQKPGLSRKRIEECIREQPDLVTDRAQTMLARLAETQQHSNARSYVAMLARIFRRVKNEPIRAVLADEIARLRRREANSAREERLKAAQGKFLTERQKSPGKLPVTSSPSGLPSLTEAVAQMCRVAGAEHTLPYGRNLLEPDSRLEWIPEYVFRGEGNAYPTTCSSLVRLRTGSVLSPAGVQDILRIADFLVAALKEKWELSDLEALGFLQHYGYPTDFLDVTLDASVASSFATSTRVGTEGCVCIIPTKPLRERGSFVDLRHHSLAIRPRRQSAFAIHLPEYPDLKAPEAIKALQLTWIRFCLTEADAARFLPRFELLDARSDSVAGLIWLMIDDYGKFSDEAARYLSQRISPANFFAVVGRDGRTDFVAGDEVRRLDGGTDEEFSRTHYERWSDAFVARPPLPAAPKLDKPVTAADLPPGTVVRVLSTNMIGRRQADAKRLD